MGTESARARQWASRLAADVYDTFIPVALERAPSPCVQNPIIFVSSGGYSPTIDYEAQREWRRTLHHFTERTPEMESLVARMNAASREGTLFENAVIQMLCDGLWIDIAKTFLKDNQVWTFSSIAYSRQELAEDLYRRYEDRHSTCNFYDHLSPDRLIVHVQGSRESAY